MNKILRLYNKKIKLDEELREEIAKKEHDMDMCDCDKENGTVDFVHHGNMFYEVISYCLDCGGLVEHD